MSRPALLLDYGGVLYEWRPGYEDRLAAAAARLLESMGVEATVDSVRRVLDEWRIAYEVQQSIRYAAALILARHGLTPTPGRVETLAQVMMDVLVSEAVAAEGARELLLWAHATGVPVAIVTNNWCYECVVRVLHRDDLAWLVEAVVSSDQVGFCKPRPEIYRAAVELLGADPSRTAFIDDLKANVEGARRAGIGLAIWHDRGRVSSLTEYIPVLEEFYSSR